MKLHPSTYLLLPAFGVLFLACGPERPTSADTTSPVDGSVQARVPSASAAPVTLPRRPPRSGVASSADPCANLPPVMCARTNGCFLDQITYRELVCRAADDACESSVRHADLIGPDADPAVDTNVMRAAVTRCETSKMCTATKGQCSCACALLGDCDCDCGGHYLPRCVTRFEAQIYEGQPPSEVAGSPIEAWGRALVAVRRSPRTTAFVVDPLPDPALLVGRSRHEIEGTLGTAIRCTGKATPSAPCQSADQAFYSLYRLPTGSRGGGPELVVTYDAQNKCTRATIAHTR